MMGEAARSPLQGNYVELARMRPEKVVAFTKSSAAVANEWWAIQSDWLIGTQQLGTIASKGRPPTMAELSALTTRNARLAMQTFERASEIADKGLAPIHATATANARRLKRRKP